MQVLQEWKFCSSQVECKRNKTETLRRYKHGLTLVDAKLEDVTEYWSWTVGEPNDLLGPGYRFSQ